MNSIINKLQETASAVLSKSRTEKQIAESKKGAAGRAKFADLRKQLVTARKEIVAMEADATKLRGIAEDVIKSGVLASVAPKQTELKRLHDEITPQGFIKGIDHAIALIDSIHDDNHLPRQDFAAGNLSSVGYLRECMDAMVAILETIPQQD